MRKLVLVLLVTFLLAPLALATSADKMNFYGRVCVTTAVLDRDKEYIGMADDDTDTIWDMTDARLGFDFKLSDVLSAKVEIRSNLVSTNMTRHWYGAWKFSDIGTFVVGRTWAPTFQAITSSNFITGAGDVQGSLREDGLQLWFDIGGGTLKVAALNPAQSTIWGTTANDWDKELPKIEASYNHKFGPVDMNFFGGWQSTAEEDVEASGTSAIDVDSWVLGMTGAWDPKPFYLKGAFYIGQNLTEYGWGAPYDNAIAAAVYSETAGTFSVADTDYMAFCILAGFVVNDRFELEGGWMRVEMDQDYTISNTTYETEEGFDEYYVMATYKLADGVYMYPEIAFMDCDDGDYIVSTGGSSVTTTTKREGWTMYGIYWRINF